MAATITTTTASTTATTTPTTTTPTPTPGDGASTCTTTSTNGTAPIGATATLLPCGKPAAPPPLVDADDEWSLLRAVIVGRAEHSCFPHEPAGMIAATMPAAHAHRFQAARPFPAEIVQQAERELDGFAELLQRQGVAVERPAAVDWLQHGGYTGAMPRDALLVVGNTIIESCYAWRCRAREVELALGALLARLERHPGVRVVRAPANRDPEAIYATSTATDTVDKGSNADAAGCAPVWAINESRPAFDAADFCRFGTTLIAQRSHVTNAQGLAYVRRHLPAGYTVEELCVTDAHAMHIDATILPLREGLLVYNPERVAEASLRAHALFRDWELVPFPFAQQIEDRGRRPDGVPRYMTSAWLVINVLVLGHDRVVVEEEDHDFAAWLENRGMTVFRLPFRHVHAIGGSFHCATVDLWRTKDRAAVA